MRFLFAAIALAAGDATALVCLTAFPSQPLLPIYSMFSVAGWAIVGLPLLLLDRRDRLARLPWLLVVGVGATLGLLALLVIFISLFALQGRITAFSLAHTAPLWPFAAGVSTVAFVVYSSLVRWRSPAGE